MALDFVVATTAGEELATLPASERKLVLRLVGSCDASFSMSGFAEEAGSIAELASDLIVYWRRGGGQRVKLFRGRFGPSGDDVSEEDHRCQFSAVDYQGVIGRRIVHTAATQLFNADQSDIVWTLIDQAQDDGIVPGSALGITRGVGQSTGVIRVAYEVPAGKWVGESVNTLAQLDGGFDLAISPDLALDIYFPSRGNPVEFVAMHGSTVRRVRRNVDTSKFATLVRQTGAAGVSPWTVTSADIATRPEGRWDLPVGDPDLANISAVVAAAGGALALADRLPPTYTATLRNGVWDPTLLREGDTCPLVVKSGRLNLAPDFQDPSTWLRVMQIDINESDEGEEVVDVTFGRPPLDLFPERDLAARVARLERNP